MPTFYTYCKVTPTYGIGQYQHVLDRWGIIYNQPIVLGTRQAGAAIEGAVRQQVVNTTSGER